jgi:hypothetical protein
MTASFTDCVFVDNLVFGNITSTGGGTLSVGGGALAIMAGNVNASSVTLTRVVIANNSALVHGSRPNGILGAGLGGGLMVAAGCGATCAGTLDGFSLTLEDTVVQGNSAQGFNTAAAVTSPAVRQGSSARSRRGKPEATHGLGTPASWSTTVTLGGGAFIYLGATVVVNVSVSMTRCRLSDNVVSGTDSAVACTAALVTSGTVNIR